MKFKYLKSKHKKDLLLQFKELFGISSLPGVLFEAGKDKIRAFSGNMTKEELQEISGILNVELVGLYLIRQEKNILRLSMDGCQLLKNQIKNNIFELSDEQFYDWIRRKDLALSLDRGTWAIKYKKDFISCGYSNTEKLFNFVPKSRSIRKS